MIVRYRRQDMREEKIEWVENPFPKKMFKMFCVGSILVVAIVSITQMLFGLTDLKHFLMLYLPFILLTILLFLSNLFATPRQVGFSAKGIFFRYYRGNVKSIPWDEIEKVELSPPTDKIMILLKSGKIPLILISYNVAREIKRQHEEYKKEKGLS